MNVHISYKVHKTPDIEKEINHLIEKLRKRLQVFRPELVHLKGVIEQNSPREGTIVSLNLRLPSGQMAVQESASTATAAVKTAFDDLLQQLTKHKDLLRSSHKWPRWRRGADTRPATKVAFEDTVASVQAPTVSSDDIRSYVNANLKRLERFVERELYFRETAEQLLPDFVNKEEVIDEVIARALGDGGEKPERLALEPWLYRLAIRSIDDLSSSHQESLSSVPLEESVRKRNVRASDEAELQFHQPDETFTEETVIPDRRTATPEDIAYSDEMVSLVQYALDGTSRADREVFILHAIEGFSVDEIVAITDRKPGEIMSSIVATREHLRRSPPLGNRSNNKLQKTGTD
ncbi:MAG TPA: HPF/RaiA family ribosome-associated protein [Terriglobales bacterium]|nr:HPF/RaiA family ribosome-associated protein [Terriglobales bacterium]